ncbi:MAG TPA: type ISP restriction/modification enzyme [Terriglobia bacterium]|nr:type ISP restriction/modification enzyme [Terriglobia bacterium]
MSVIEGKAVLAALREFAGAVTAKMTSLTAGEPEDQLRAPFEAFMHDLGVAVARDILCTGETRLPGRLGKPDYAVHASGALVGYAELKAPGLGANPKRYTGHNANQWKRFSAIPNLLYCDGNDWALYRNGELAGHIARLSGSVETDGREAVAPGDAGPLFGLLTDFLSWQPLIPTTSKGEIDLKRLAELLAPLCRMLRQDVTDALRDPRSPLVELARDWRQLLFPDASDEQFADAYAQTVTFALLLGRSEGAAPLTLGSAEGALAADHTLLSRALQVLTDPNALAEISASVNLLVRIVGAVPPAALKGPKEPWLYFYEDFLAAYDPKLRKDVGAYYTPVEVVRAQVRLIDDLLTNRLGKELGFADPGVVTLDPGVGTGTYLLGVIQQALAKVEAQQGPGAVPGRATALARNIYGFEIMVGPFAVSELRVSRALESKGAHLPADGTHIYLTDTLERPDTPPPRLPLFLRPIADQHARALKVKAKVPVIVCLGNPPYDRHEAAAESNKARTGGWVRWAEDGKGTGAILKDFLDPAIAAGHGVHIKNLYNLYVYFWRWALWKVLEQNSSPGPGIVSYISASSYLGGEAFCGMREHMRHLCDEIWILDLGGEGRGTRRSENVFAIQTPVAIAVAVRYGKVNKDKAAKVWYARIEGTRDEKLTALEHISSLAAIDWEDCPDDWLAPFEPAGKGHYFDWPLLTDLFPWQHSGAQFKRTWPISADPSNLKARWHALLTAKDRARAFKETRDRKIGSKYPPLIDAGAAAVCAYVDLGVACMYGCRPIEKVPAKSPAPRIARYAYRSFDRRWVLADNRLGDFLRPVLWTAHSERQVYLTTIFSQPLGAGPALTACAAIPDLDHFRGSYGAKAAMPLYRDAGCKEPNIRPGLLDAIAKAYGRTVTPEDFLAYVYGLLAHPAFTKRYAEDLGSRDVRVPITRDAALFQEIGSVGARLLWLHTYAERYVPNGHRRGQVPEGSARCTRAVPGDKDSYPASYGYNDATKTLSVGAGAFAPVTPEVYNFEVSGLKVVQSWLGYRMRNPKGKKSSPLDEIHPEKWTSEFTTELLELLWILEATIAEYPHQSKLLTAVTVGAKIRL